jgi:hypothetical protein
LKRIIKRFEHENQLDSFAVREALKVLRNDRIIQQVKIDPKISASMLTAQEVSRTLKVKGDYNGRITRKTSIINKINREKRLNFAKQHILQDQRFWNDVH